MLTPHERYGHFQLFNLGSSIKYDVQLFFVLEIIVYISQIYIIHLPI